MLGFLPAWGIVYQPFAAVLFLIAGIAENKRIPFDLPEAESELISGYFTEYSAMKQGVFMLSEFIEIAVIGALFVTLFFGGYNLPWMNDTGFVFPGGHALPLSHGWVVVLQLLTFLGKVFLLCSFQLLVRWTLPRFRWDQLLRFAWKFLLPLAIANLVVTAVALWAQQPGCGADFRRTSHGDAARNGRVRASEARQGRARRWRRFSAAVWRGTWPPCEPRRRRRGNRAPGTRAPCACPHLPRW